MCSAYRCEYKQKNSAYDADHDQPPKYRQPETYCHQEKDCEKNSTSDFYHGEFFICHAWARISSSLISMAQSKNVKKNMPNTISVPTM